jgi:hypothetical protein
VVIFDWHLRSRTFLNGINLTTMAADYTALTGRPFPAGAVPVPPASDPDQELRNALDPWSRSWPKSTKPKQAYQAWKVAKGYRDSQ